MYVQGRPSATSPSAAPAINTPTVLSDAAKHCLSMMKCWCQQAHAHWAVCWLQVWKIKRFSGAAEHSLRAEVTMVSTTKERKPWARPPISMNFQVRAHPKR